jgi:paraquat-inducible protein A
MVERVLPGGIAWGAKPQVETQCAHEVQCPYCGLVQFVEESERSHVTYCARCRSRLEHCAGTSTDLSLACALSALLLFIPAWTLPFLTSEALGATRTSHLASSVTILWQQDQHLLSVVVCLFLLVFPVVRFVSLTAVLFTLRIDKHPRWLAGAFRVYNSLQTWSMPDVFLLGLLIAYERLRSSIPTTIGSGALCFMAAVVLGVIARATLNKVGTWRMIAAEQRVQSDEPLMACQSCGLLLPAHPGRQSCPRCGATVRPRKPHSFSIALALLIASGLFYLPANLYPIATIPIGLKPTSYTVLGGVVDLLESHLFGLALIVFTASFTIPLLKMAGLAWCIVSALCPAPTHLIVKTRVYRVIEEVGRWSMVDPLTISCFVPVLQFNALIDGQARDAATAFTAVVILTTIAVKAFDPRLMWDAAGSHR